MRGRWSWLLISIKVQNRNELLFNDLIGALKMGRSPLLLTERVEHLEQFAEQLNGFAQNIIVLRAP